MYEYLGKNFLIASIYSTNINVEAHWSIENSLVAFIYIRQCYNVYFWWKEIIQGQEAK